MQAEREALYSRTFRTHSFSKENELPLCDVDGLVKP